MLLLISGFNVLAGNGVGNGGGIAEQNVTFAWQTLFVSLSNCMADPACTASAGGLREMITLREARVYSPETLVQFADPKTHPELFKRDGNGGWELMSTQANKAGAPIYVNQARLYRESASGRIEALSIEDASATLAGKLAEKQNWDSKAVASLEAGLKSYFDHAANLLTVVPLLNFDHPEFRLMVLKSARGGRMHWVLDDGDNLTNLDSLVQKQAPCSSLGMLTDQISADNLQWSSSSFWNSTSFSHTVSLKGSAELECRDKIAGTVRRIKGSVILNFNVKVADSALRPVLNSGAENLLKKPKHYLVPVHELTEADFTDLH